MHKVKAFIPATVAGGLQCLKLLQQRDVSGKLKAAASTDEKLGVARHLHPKLKRAFVHAILNDIVIAGAAWNWYMRRRIIRAQRAERVDQCGDSANLRRCSIFGWEGGIWIWRRGKTELKRGARGMKNVVSAHWSLGGRCRNGIGVWRLISTLSNSTVF
jgi:hypothetical protein